jgi:hypothetical protein
MKREERLKFCETCSNKKFDLNQGTICGLTMKIADFENQCDDYNENMLYTKKILERKSNIGASKTKRVINYFIDINLSCILALLIIAISPNEFENFIFFPIIFLYYFLTEYFFNKSIAKFLTRTKIVNKKGIQPTVKELLIRNLCRFIPFEQFSFLGSNSKGWHDSFSNTTVIDDK